MAMMIIKEPGRGIEQVTAREHFITTIDGKRLAAPGESGIQLAAPGQMIPLPLAEKLGIGRDGHRLAPVVKEQSPAETKDLQPAETKRKRRK
jgi:hypothetical protein